MSPGDEKLQAGVSKLVGKTVVVRGNRFSGSYAYHHAPIVMGSAKSISGEICGCPGQSHLAASLFSFSPFLREKVGMRGLSTRS